MRRETRTLYMELGTMLEAGRENQIRDELMMLAPELHRQVIKHLDDQK